MSRVLIYTIELEVDPDSIPSEEQKQSLASELEDLCQQKGFSIYDTSYEEDSY